MDANNILWPSLRTYFRIQERFLNKVVEAEWNDEMAAVRAITRSNGTVIVAGDGR